ncbi:MAG TPA: alpha/beta hydrolase, partial [Pseudonocardiaceae bacterium]
RDLDVLRSVLGDEKLTYLGYSYGTRLGTTYAEMFPDNVRALVLDGAVDPSQDLVEQLVAQAAGFQRSFDAFAASCTAREQCPLGNDPAQAVSRFRALVDPLLQQPVPAGNGRSLSHGDAQTGVIQALYSEQLWPLLEKGLSELAQGRGDTLMLLADTYYGRGEDGRYTTVLDALTAVRCMDDPRVTDRAVVAEADRRYREAAPFLDDGNGPSPALDACAFWPVPPTSEPHELSVPGLPQVLVISTTGDPATPYQAGVDLARALNARLLTYQGEQHTVALQGVPCVDEVVVDYLVDLRLPETNTIC